MYCLLLCVVLSAVVDAGVWFPSDSVVFEDVDDAKSAVIDTEQKSAVNLFNKDDLEDDFLWSFGSKPSSNRTDPKLRDVNETKTTEDEEKPDAALLQAVDAELIGNTTSEDKFDSLNHDPVLESVMTTLQLLQESNYIKWTPLINCISEQLRLYNTSKCNVSNNEVYFNGSCEQLNTQSICPDTQWLVLTENELRPICEQRRCGKTEVYINGTCVNKLIEREYCGEGQRFYVDVHGVGFCDCHLEYGYYDEKCHKMYSKGPCEDRQVLMLNNETGTVGCFHNPCKFESTVQVNGTCYKLGDKGNCDNNGVLMLTDRLVPECMTPEMSRAMIRADFMRCRPGTRQDHRGNCRESRLLFGATCPQGTVLRMDGRCHTVSFG